MNNNISAENAIKKKSPLVMAVNFLILAVFVGICGFLVLNPNFQWDIVAKYVFDPAVLSGLGVSLILTVIVMIIGSVLGATFGLLLLSNYGPGRWLAAAYVWVFRGVPPLIQLIFWYNMAYLIPNVPVGMLWGNAEYVWHMNDLISPFTAAVLGLGLTVGGYMTEIVRAGLMSVDQRQHDAARAIGMSPTKSFFRIILPQALRFIIPPTGSQVITTIKATSLVSVIAMNDLLYSVQQIYNRTFEVIPMLLVAVFWYLLVVTLLTQVQKRIEKHYGKGHEKREVAKKEKSVLPVNARRAANV